MPCALRRDLPRARTALVCLVAANTPSAPLRCLPTTAVLLASWPLILGVCLPQMVLLAGWPLIFGLRLPQMVLLAGWPPILELRDSTGARATSELGALQACSPSAFLAGRVCSLHELQQHRCAP